MTTAISDYNARLKRAFDEYNRAKAAGLTKEAADWAQEIAKLQSMRPAEVEGGTRYATGLFPAIERAVEAGLQGYESAAEARAAFGLKPGAAFPLTPYYGKFYPTWQIEEWEMPAGLQEPTTPEAIREYQEKWGLEVPRPEAAYAPIALEDLLPGWSTTWTPEYAAGYGVELEEGWLLEVFADPDVEGEYFLTTITPEGWRITQDQLYISPEGEQYTLEQMEEIWAKQEEIEGLVGELFPEKDVEEVARYEGEQPVDFYTAIHEAGRDEQVDTLLRQLEWTEEQIEAFWAGPSPEEILGFEQALEEVFPWLMGVEPLMAWAEQYPGTFFEEIRGIGHTDAVDTLLKGLGLSDKEIAQLFGERYQWGLWGWEIPSWLQTIVGGQAGKGGIIGGIRWVDRVWPTGLALQLATSNEVLKHRWEEGTLIDADKQFLARLDEIKQSTGEFGFYFSEEAQTAFEEWQGFPGGGWGKAGMYLVNPVWWISLGGGFGLAARVLTRIPVIGKSTRIAAAVVMRTETALFYPIAKPLELGLRRVLPKRPPVTAPPSVTEAVARDVLEQSKSYQPGMMLHPAEQVLDGMIVDNWQRRLIGGLAGIPGVRRVTKPLFEKTLGWRILVRRQGEAMEGIVGRGALVWKADTAVGAGAAAIKGWELQAVERNAVRLFRFNKNAYSKNMAGRLLPEYKGAENVGTLEHVFTHPEMYNWRGLERGLEYVTKLQEINKEVLQFLKAEGVAPEHLIEAWIHRVVEGIYDAEGKLIRVGGRPGARGGGIGSKRSYELHRKATTMEEGISWGVKYNRDPLASVTSYIQEAYRKVADARFVRYVSENLEAIGKPGVKPTEELMRRFPELFEAIETAEGRRLAQRAVLRADELVAAKDFGDVISRAMRGEMPPEATLRVLETRFPDLGRQFRATLQTPKALGAIDDWLTKFEVRTKGRFGIRQRDMQVAFQSLKAEDRLAYRQVIEALIADTGDDAAKRMLRALDRVETNPNFVPKPEKGKDLFGYPEPTTPSGEATVKYISEAEYTHLSELRVKAGLSGPPPDVAIRPPLEMKGFGAKAMIDKVEYHLPKPKTALQREGELRALLDEVKSITEARKMPYWEERAEKAFRMEQIRQPGIKKGYIMQPFAGGRKFDREFIDAFNKFFGYDPGIGVLKVTSDVAGILRITKAALDASFWAIQGLPSWGLAHTYLLTNPVMGAKLMGRWYQTFAVGLASFFKPEVLAARIAQIESRAMQRLSYGGSARSIDYFAALEARGGIGGLAEKAMARIPGQPYHRAETMFFGSGEMIRDWFWEIMSPKAIRAGKGFELARFLDRITGLTDAASMGVPLTIRQLEQSFVWFAPNYTRACLTVLADVFRGGFTGAQARRAIGGMIAAGSTMYAGVQYSIAMLEGKSEEEAWDTVLGGFGVVQDPITGEWDWKPSARFMTLKVGNYHFGFGGFWYGLLRLGGNIMATIKEVGDRELIDLVRIWKHGSFNKRDNPFIYWWYSRSSPFFGTGFELATGREFLGYPIETPREYGEYILSRFEPIWAEQGLNWRIPGLARDQEVPEGLARKVLAPAEFFGLRTFPEGAWGEFYDKANEIIEQVPRELFEQFYSDEELAKVLEAHEAGKLKWEQIPDPMRMQLRLMYPELEELYQAALTDSLVRDSDNWKQWSGRMEEEETVYYERGAYLIGEVLAGNKDTRWLREEWGEAGQNYGIALDSIEKEPAYSVIYDYFEKRAAEGNKYDWSVELALSEYQNIMFADYTDDKGDMDWDARDRAIDEYIGKYGEDTYLLIREMYADKKLLEGLSPVLIRLAEDKDKLGREYWRLPYKPIIEMDEDDMAEGNIPAEYWPHWQVYQQLETDRQRAMYIKEHPDIARDWRAEYRLAHSEADAMLALWGYGGKLKSLEAYELVAKWGQELGIPLEQMGLGLPPRSLVADYFAYGKIPFPFSGWERDRFLQEHPDFFEWGQEAYDWQDIDFSRIPSREVEALWNRYQGLIDSQTDKADARARLALRCGNPDLDEWLVRVKDYKPAYGTDRCRGFARPVETPMPEAKEEAEFEFEMPVWGGVP